MNLPNPYICDGGPWHAQVLWLCIGKSTLTFTVGEWHGRYVKRVPEVRASVAGAKSSQPLMDWEPA
jgi:hypothetical protein